MGLMTRLKSKIKSHKRDGGGQVAGYALNSSSHLGPDSNKSTTASSAVSPEERRRLAAEAAENRLAQQRAKGGLSAQTQEELRRRQLNPQQDSFKVARTGAPLQSDQVREMLT
eukprot:Protomagalhaensia_sp_Gyna_25__5112@NODE_590_length_3048_cov_265_155201_g457_i0_p5_GENE_NODE_590_length_3048_cov_265_155201_g457_i0NODE_590_length_3048_cov_265_155201_g457_i0_p5_ORF_typecomplete_len113_score23_25SVIP/PF15811_5/5_8e07dbPDZ_assoc/PF16610_5/0_043_NODE_590_length_3048_cov_265_155201_g457_i08721210